jgi:hypothetical protein
MLFSDFRLVGKGSYLLGQLANRAIGCEFATEDLEFVMHLFCDVMRYARSLLGRVVAFIVRPRLTSLA